MFSEDPSCSAEKPDSRENVADGISSPIDVTASQQLSTSSDFANQRGDSYDSEVVNERKYHHTPDEALPQPGTNKHASSTSGSSNHFETSQQLSPCSINNSLASGTESSELEISSSYTETCDETLMVVSTYDIMDETHDPDLEVDNNQLLSGVGDCQSFPHPEGTLDGDEIEWSEEDMKSEEYEQYMEDEADSGLDFVEETVAETAQETAQETETTPECAVKVKSLSHHLQYLEDSAATKDNRSSYLQCLRQIPHHYQGYKKTKPAPKTKLGNFKKVIEKTPYDVNDKSKEIKRYLKIQAPVLHTLLNLLNFIPDLDTKNKIVAWLMHPRHSKQLAHLFKTVLSSKTLWEHVIKKSRKKILKYTVVPKTSAPDMCAFPVVPLKKSKVIRDFVPHQKCQFYHDKRLCRYKITGLQGKVRNILQKYDIAVKTSYCGSRTTNFPEEYTSTSSVRTSESDNQKNAPVE